MVNITRFGLAHPSAGPAMEEGFPHSLSEHPHLDTPDEHGRRARRRVGLILMGGMVADMALLPPW